MSYVFLRRTVRQVVVASAVLVGLAPTISFGLAGAASAATASAPVITNVLTDNEDTIDNQFYPVIATTGDGVTSVVSTTPAVCNVDPLADIVVYASTGTCTLIPQVAAGTRFGANLNGTPYSFTVVDAVTSGTVTYAERDWWSGGYNASLTIANPSGANIGSPTAPWSLTFTLPEGTTIASFSGASYTTAPPRPPRLIKSSRSLVSTVTPSFPPTDQ